jgi:xanthine dehydrogenase YagT iron-sulfur-binding subunit
MSLSITLTINGTRRTVELDDPRVTLLDLAQGEALHPVQAAFIAHDAFQCGFCTPGQIMSAVGLIREGRAGDDPERVREGMSGNLCRCGAYRGITEAVLEAQRSLAQAGRKEAA